MMNKPFQTGMRWWLLALVLLAVLPLFLFSGYVLRELGRAREDALHADLFQHIDAAAHAVHERLGMILGQLDTLASSDAAQRGDLPALYERARRVVQVNPSAVAITLVAPDGQTMFTTRHAFGSPDFPTQRMNAVGKVCETAKPAVSGLLLDPATGKMVVTLSVPILQSGKVAYCLRMALFGDSFSELLGAQQLPADWSAAIVDSRGIVVARAHLPESFVGNEAATGMMAVLQAGRRGVFDTLDKEGKPLKTVFITLPSWNWKVVMEAPAAAQNASLNLALDQLTAIGIVLVAVGILATLRLAHHITRQLLDVVSAARALQQGRRSSMPRIGGICELDEVRQALAAIDEREQRTNFELFDITVRHEQVAGELLSARCDDLTGLPGRALFVESCSELRKSVAVRGGRKLALLFIDLDGFKAVNDSLGHEQGDSILVQTAGILRSLVRETDIAARLGGDEFIVCVAAPTGSIEATAKSIASRIVEQIRGIGGSMGCSIGIAVWPDNCPDVSWVMRRADEAMYEAKRRGKNGYVVFGDLRATVD